MKHAFTKGLFVAATATLIAACSTDDAADQMPVAPGKIEVSLKAALPQSRAQIEVDESNGRFSGSWEATDELTVYAKGSQTDEETQKFTYDASSKVFKGKLADATQDWTYQAVYPAVDATPLNIPFGAERTQKGSNFNGAYDPLVSAPVTHAGAEPGKTPQGEAVTFGLNRLTAILALTFETDAATVKAEKVKSVALTAAGKTIAAKSFDITRDDQSGALNASEPSETITLSYEAGSEPAAASFKAYFNVPADTYGKLSVVITTEGHTKALNLTTDGIELLRGELAYTTKAVSDWTALGPELSVTWETNPTFEPVEITNDMKGKCNIVINAPAGIKAFTVSMLSDYLNNDIELTELDLLNPQGLETIFDMLNFPYGEKILNQKTVPFDLTNAVALLEGKSGQHIFTMNVTDNNNKTINQDITFFVPEAISATVSDIDLWKNTATITLNNAPEGATVQYKRSTESEWKNTTKNPNGTFSITPSWITEENDAGKTVYSLDNNCGVFAGATYDWQILNGEAVVASGTFETSAGDPIENGDMSQWCETKEMLPLFGSKKKITVWYPGSSWSDSTPGFWDSSNNAGNKTACTQDKTKNASCAWLQASGVSLVGALASGSLFTGTFTYANMNGTASFGQKYKYTARPTALRLKYHATLGTVNYNKHNGPLEKNKDIMDQCSFTVCIVDWDTRHDVQSGTSAPKGIWDPITMGELPVDKQNGIIGYGVKYSSENTPGTDLIPLEIPIKYYQQTNAAPDGENKFTIIISVSTSRYGDYLNGCDKNKIYVDDFEWVY